MRITVTALCPRISSSLCTSMRKANLFGYRLEILNIFVLFIYTLFSGVM